MQILYAVRKRSQYFCVEVTGQRDACQQLHSMAEKHADVVDLFPEALANTILQSNVVMDCVCALQWVGGRC